MGIQFAWDNHHPDILWFEVVGMWTWMECRDLASDLFTYLRTENRHIDCIIDMHHAGAIPSGHDDPCVRRTLEDAPGYLGLLVIVGADRFTCMMISLMQQNSPVIQRKVIVVDSWDDAYRVILSRRAGVR